MHPLIGAIREKCAPGRKVRIRKWAILVVALAAFVPLYGCGGGGSSGSGEEPLLLVEYFNHHQLPGVLLNSPLVFRFSTAVDPASVNINTIQIWTNILGKRADAVGTFEVNGATVTWYPQMTSKVYPLAPANPPDPIMPADAGLNTKAAGFFSYSVLVPSSPNPNTVKSASGKTVRVAFTSTFETAQGPKSITTPANSTSVMNLFDGNAPYFSDTIRIADVIAYGGNTTPPSGYLGWLDNPLSSGGENPLYVAPGFYWGAVTNWENRRRTGELVDQILGIQLVPRLSSLDMANNVFPPGAPVLDERFVSNLLGTQKGRGREVQAINVYFTQPIAPDSFLDKNNNPKTYDKSPFAIKVLPTASTVPSTVTDEPFTITFLNNTDQQIALVNFTLNRVIMQGWIYIQALGNQVKGMPGGQLEENTGAAVEYIWPVRINAL